MENLGSIGQPTYSLRVDGVRPDAAALLLRLNTVLQGEVLQLLDGGSIVLGVGSHRVPADTQVELKLGQKFLFQVQENEGKLVLKILPEAAQQETGQSANSFSMFQRAAGKDAPMGETLGKLAQALLALVGESPDPQQANTPPRLPGKPPLDAATLAFLRDTATALQQEWKASWPEPQGSTVPGTPGSASSTAFATNPNSLPGNAPSATALPMIVLAADSALPVPAPPAATKFQSLAAPETPNPASPNPGNSNPVSLPNRPSSLQLPVPSSIPALAPSNLSSLPASSKEATPSALNMHVPASLSHAALRDLLTVLQRPEIRESLQALTRYLENGAVTPDAARPEAIRQHIAESGIPLESQLRRLVQAESRENPETLGRKDLKTLLLRVEERIGESIRRLGESAEPELAKTLSEFGERVKQSRESVEAKQVQNALRQDSGEALHFQIPYQDLGRLRTADLYYDRRQEQDRKAPAVQRTVHHLVFLLEMSKLGELRVDALLRGSRIQIAVNTSEDEAADFLRSRLVALQSKLEELGFEVGLLDCRSGLARREASSRAVEFDLPVFGERHLVDLEG